MRAVVITQSGAPEVLEIQDVEMPEPVGDQVRVRVRASGINRADLLQRAGGYPAPAGSPSNIPGLEFAGEVDAVGPLARMWKPGQRVMGLAGGGAQAQYIGVHVVIDFIGAPYMEQNLQALAMWGRMVFLATMGGTQANVNLGMLMGKRISMRGVTLRTRTLEEKLAVTRRFATSVVPLLANGKIKPVIEHVYAFEEIGEVHRTMGENKNFGKLIVRIE